MRIPGLRIDADLDGLPWRSTRYAGVEWLDLARGEPAGGAAEGTMAVLIRMAPGRGYPAHRHLGAEDVLVLRGGYRDGDGLCLRAGAFHRYPAGSEHGPVALGDPARPEGEDNPACVLYALAHGGTELVGAGEAAGSGTGTDAAAAPDAGGP